jgi:hypothetical protein
MKQYLNFLTTSATKHISIKVAPFTNAAIDTQDLANKINTRVF